MSTTIFHIGCNDTVAEIKSRFSHLFPNFEINFFTGIGDFKSNNACAMYSPGVRVQDISHQCQDGHIELNDQMKMEEIELLIHDLFKLNPQVRPVVHERRFNFNIPVRPKLILFKDVPFGC